MKRFVFGATGHRSLFPQPGSEEPCQCTDEAVIGHTARFAGEGAHGYQKYERG
jgi:hypothetical protein